MANGASSSSGWRASRTGTCERWTELFREAGRAVASLQDRHEDARARVGGTAIRQQPHHAADAGGGRPGSAGLSRHGAALDRSPRRTPRPSTSRRIRPCTRGSCRRSWGVKASRGTSPAPAATCAAWSTASTTASRRTSASSPVSSAPTSLRTSSSSAALPGPSPTRCRWVRVATWRRKAKPKCRRIRSRWSAMRCG